MRPVLFKLGLEQLLLEVGDRFLIQDQNLRDVVVMRLLSLAYFPYHALLD